MKEIGERMFGDGPSELSTNLNVLYTSISKTWDQISTGIKKYLNIYGEAVKALSFYFNQD